MPHPSVSREAKTAGNARRLSVVLFLVTTSVALATVVLPAGGYRGAIAIAVVLVAGCVVGLVVLLSAAVAVNAMTRRRRRRAESLADTAHSYTALGLALGVLIAVVGIVELMRGA